MNFYCLHIDHDPGWNDPPKLLGYNPTSPGQTKLNLNKRVAFPLAQGQIAPPLPSKSGNSSLPPIATPPISIAPVESKTADKSSKVELEEELSNEEMFKAVESAMTDSIAKIDASKRPEIQKRIEIMLQMWKEEKFNEFLYKKLYSLVQSMKEERLQEATDIHRSIIVEHGTISVQWGPALRQVLLTIPTSKGDVSEAVNNLGANIFVPSQT